MKEPSLSCETPGQAQAYRLLWLRTFHHPVAVRVTDSAEKISLDAIELDGKGGYFTGGVLRRKKTTLSKTQFQVLLDAFSKADFWSVATREDGIGLDGAEWVLEGARQGNYHVVSRLSPRDGDVREIGLLFLKLAKWSFKDKEIY
jgi:hypothetical protein